VPRPPLGLGLTLTNTAGGGIVLPCRRTIATPCRAASHLSESSGCGVDSTRDRIAALLLDPRLTRVLPVLLEWHTAEA
jgi:hypothetical protein